jgi:hypothetical protein
LKIVEKGLNSGAPDAELSRSAREWLRNKWTRPVFMAVGMKDPMFGPPVMQVVRNDIRHCPEPYEHSETGHFVPEWGEKVAKKALAFFDSQKDHQF